MERLTEHRDNGEPFYHLSSCKNGQNYCLYDDKSGCECEEVTRVIDRLAAIEDILGDEYDIDELRETIQAKREGRCVVMPCKIGDPVWKLYDDCDFPGDCYTKQKCRGCEYRNLFIEEQAFCLSMLCQNGKLAPPYYTIRAEAEAALKAREALDDGNE